MRGLSLAVSAVVVGVVVRGHVRRVDRARGVRSVVSKRHEEEGEARVLARLLRGRGTKRRGREREARGSEGKLNESASARLSFQKFEPVRLDSFFCQSQNSTDQGLKITNKVKEVRMGECISLTRSVELLPSLTPPLTPTVL